MGAYWLKCPPLILWKYARAIVGDAGVSKFYELVEAADVFKYAFADVRV